MNAFARLLLCTALSGLALGAQARTFEVSDFAELANAVREAEAGDELGIKRRAWGRAAGCGAGIRAEWATNEPSGPA